MCNPTEVFELKRFILERFDCIKIMRLNRFINALLPTKGV